RVVPASMERGGLRQSDQALVDVAVDLENQIPLNVDIEHLAADRLLTRCCPTTAGINRITRAAEDVQGIAIIGKGQHVVGVKLEMEARRSRGVVVHPQVCRNRSLVVVNQVAHHRHFRSVLTPACERFLLYYQWDALAIDNGVLIPRKNSPGRKAPL